MRRKSYYGWAGVWNAAYCSQMDLFVEEHSCEVGIGDLRHGYFEIMYANMLSFFPFLGLQKD